jgi:hypothetical protein
LSSTPSTTPTMAAAPPFLGEGGADERDEVEKGVQDEVDATRMREGVSAVKSVRARVRDAIDVILSVESELKQPSRRDESGQKERAKGLGRARTSPTKAALSYPFHNRVLLLHTSTCLHSKSPSTCVHARGTLPFVARPPPTAASLTGPGLADSPTWSLKSASRERPSFSPAEDEDSASTLLVPSPRPVPTSP